MLADKCAIILIKHIIEGEIMKTKLITLLIATALTASIISGCGKTTVEDSGATNVESAAENDTKDTTAETAENITDSSDSSKSNTYEELVASLHAGQSYAYAPICQGGDALLVTSYTYDDLEGHIATYEATIFIEKDGTLEKVTTVQTAGTAYPIAVAKDNSLILSNRNSIQKGYVDKETGKYVVTAEASIDYTNVEAEEYHNYQKDVSDVPTDSSVYDMLSEDYGNSEILSFTSAGISADGAPNFAGGVYAVYAGDDQYNINSYFIFDSETSGHTQTPDGISGIPFEYEQNGDSVTFHFGSADNVTEGKFNNEYPSFPAIVFTGDNEFGADKITLTCLGNQNPATFDAVKYYDNDNNLYMQVKSFNENSFTGDLCREERIKKEYVENAEIGSNIFSVNGTQYTAVSFEDVNKELEYDTDETFKKDVVGTTRFDGFLVKCSDDDFFYALEKEDYAEEYTVVQLFEEGKQRKTIEENVTFNIKEDCEIYLYKEVEKDGIGKIETEYIIGREFKGDNYPGWSENAKEYYMTGSMLMAISVVDGELYNAVQVYIP
jgi:hypothetical protein